MHAAAATGVLTFLTVSLAIAGPDPLVPAVRDAVQPEIDRHIPEANKDTLADLARADSVKARFKPPLRQRAVKDP